MSRFREGDHVRITCGQLAGLTGEVCGSGPPGRVILLLDDYEVLLEIDRRVLELMVPAAAETN